MRYIERNIENATKYLNEEKFDLLLPLKKNEKSLILLSGGIDSTVALYLAKKLNSNITGMQFFYQGRPLKEKKNIKKICGLIGIQKVDVSYPFAVETDSREKISLNESNAFYYITASNFADKKDIEKIISGQILTDWYPKMISFATPSHYKKLNRIIKDEYSEKNIKILLPFMYLNKRQVVGLGKKLGVPFELTSSCPTSEEPCTVCPQCEERVEAFKLNGI
jgi:7-cyano-7-deazaguanine synthase